MGKKILFISYDGMTDPLGQSQVIPYLRGLSAKGHGVYILSFEKKERYEAAKGLISTILNEANITWIPLGYTSKPPVISTLWDIWQMSKAAQRLLKTEKIDLLHCRSYISALVGLKLKKKYGMGFVFDMRGFWADERVEGKLWNTKNILFNLIYTFFKRKEIAFFNASDYTISLTTAGANIIRHWPSIRKDIRIKVIPCCADLNHFDYTKISSEQTRLAAQRLSIPEGTVVITYLGSLGTWYMLDEMLDFFAVFQRFFPESIMLFITTDNVKQILDKAIVKGISSDSLRTTKASRNELPALLSVSAASLFFIRPSFSKQASSPTKMGELMGMGIPIICNTGVGDIATIMNDTRSGISIDSFLEADYISACKKFNQILTIPKSHIRTGAQSWYSLSEGIERYGDVYESM